MLKHLKVDIALNSKLAKEKGLSDEVKDKIERLQFLRQSLYDLSTTLENKRLLVHLGLMVEDLDFQLQDLWGFVRDAGFHEWYLIPACTCPKLDNQEARGPGSDYRTYSSDCPIHGSIVPRPVDSAEKITDNVRSMSEKTGEFGSAVIDRTNELKDAVSTKAAEVKETLKGGLLRGLKKLTDKIEHQK